MEGLRRLQTNKPLVSLSRGNIFSVLHGRTNRCRLLCGEEKFLGRGCLGDYLSQFASKTDKIGKLPIITLAYQMITMLPRNIKALN